MTASLDISGDFPILARQVNGQPLTYLDSAATTQKPRAVIDAIRHYYERRNANVHRAAHALAEEATAAMEAARAKVAALVGAGDARELIFTRGATEGINLVAACLTGRLGPGDEVLITEMEHHSNIVPWQLVAERVGARIEVVPITDSGELDMDGFARKLNARTRIVSMVHVSNALGTINPVEQVARMAKEQGAPLVLDGAQAAPHVPLDLPALGCDFYAISGHKMYGPSGIGVLWGKRELLAKMPPYQGGGEMIRSVRFEGTSFADPPARFEAGTPNIAGPAGLAAAADYLETMGLPAIAAHEDRLRQRAEELLGEIPGVRLIGTAPEKAAVVSFVVEDVHPHDLGTLLDQQGIAVRTGHHCTQPLMERFRVPATVRASFALYNTEEEVERLARGLREAIGIFRG